MGMGKVDVEGGMGGGCHTLGGFVRVVWLACSRSSSGTC